jgi:hypothetical protein
VFYSKKVEAKLQKKCFEAKKLKRNNETKRNSNNKLKQDAFCFILLRSETKKGGKETPYSRMFFLIPPKNMFQKNSKFGSIKDFLIIKPKDFEKVKIKFASSRPPLLQSKYK